MEVALQASQLNSQTGQIPVGSQSKVLGVVITAALSGTLTISPSVGGTANWAPSSTGWNAAPSAGWAPGPLYYALSNAADEGKCLVVWQPL